MGCRFDLGVLLEKRMHKHPQHAHTQMHARTHKHTHRNAPCRAACEADTRCLDFFFASLISVLQGFQPAILFHHYTSQSLNLNISRHRWSARFTLLVHAGASQPNRPQITGQLLCVRSCGAINLKAPQK